MFDFILELNLLEYILLALVIFFGGLLASATGFGSGIVRMPLLLQFFPASFASPIENLMGLINNLFVLAVDPKSRKSIKWKILVGLLVGNFLGALIGSNLLATLENGWLIKIVGVFIILWELKFLLETFLSKSKSVKSTELNSEKGTKNISEKRIKQNFVIDSIVGLISGLGSSLFSIGGPPLVIYMQIFFREQKEVMRASLIGFFTANGLIQIFTLGLNGLITSRVIITVLICLPILFLGSLAGKKLNDVMNKTQYKVVVSVVLILAGLILLFP